ncbi:hypothetical protein H4582DRAFT_2057843 [Lactarius indigo]|nr:hypothetical protein H4582DRAFT_2057843 [Lactarius indigo]
MAPSTRCSRLITANIRATLSQTNGAHSENVLDSQSLDLTSTSTQCTAVNQNNPDLSGIHAMIPLLSRPQPLFQLKPYKEYLQSEHESPVEKAHLRKKGLPMPIRCRSSYPAKEKRWVHHDNTHSLTSLQVDPGNQFSCDSDLNEDDIENEDDWLEDEQTVNVTHKVSAKTSEVTVTERPSWLGVDVTPPGTVQTPNRNVLDVDASGSAKNHGSAVSTPCSGTLSELGAPTIDL